MEGPVWAVRFYCYIRTSMKIGTFLKATIPGVLKPYEKLISLSSVPL